MGTRFPEEGEEKWREGVEMSGFPPRGWDQDWAPQARVQEGLGPVEAEVRRALATVSSV